MRRIIKIVLIFVFQISFSQDNEKAISTSKDVFKIIKSNDETKFYEILEDTIKTLVPKSYIIQTFKNLNESILNSNVDFEKYTTQSDIPSNNENTPRFINYRFPITINEETDFFEISFFYNGNFDKITNANIIKIHRLENVKTPKKIDMEKVPQVGEVKIIKYRDSELIREINFRNATHLTNIYLTIDQNKLFENIFEIDNPENKKVIAYYNNGEIRKIGKYNGIYPLGKVMKFYENGNIKQVSYYIENGKEDGVWKYYDKNGDLTKTEVWENGQLKNK